MITRVRKRPGVRSADAAVEDQLHLIGPADVEVLADDFLEEDAAGDGPVQNLGQRELGLQDRELIAVAGLPICGGEGMRQLAQPLPQQRVDLLRRLSRRRGPAAAWDRRTTECRYPAPRSRCPCGPVAA